MRLRAAKRPKDWVDFNQLDPSSPEFQARFASLLVRAGRLKDAEKQLDACLALLPPHSRKRLVLVVLRQRVRSARMRRELLGLDVAQAPRQRDQ
jgi:hypothetical protein